jgi:hypothetical protein
VLLDQESAVSLLPILEYENNIYPNRRRPSEVFEFNGVEYFKLYQVAIKDGLASGVDPILRFTFDPGTTDSTYKLLCYERPTIIAAETTQVEIPEHLHYTTLIPACLKMLEAHQTGNWIEFDKMMKEEWKPRLISEMSQSDQGESYTITRREE